MGLWLTCMPTLDRELFLSKIGEEVILEEPLTDNFLLVDSSVSAFLRYE